MDIKKEQILNSALKLFSNKGYDTTSIQEIVKDCGISKGSFYNYFDSKESLLLDIVRQTQTSMFHRVSSMKFHDEMDKRLVFHQKLFVYIENFHKNKNLIMIPFQDMPEIKEEELRVMLRQSKTRFVNWLKESMLEAYGSKIEAHIWDIMTLLHGIMKEFFKYMDSNNRILYIEKLAKFIVERIDAFVDGLNVEEEPIITEKLLHKCSKTEYKPYQMTYEEKLTQLLVDMKAAVHNLVCENHIKIELFAAVDFLEEELFKSTPRAFLINALIAYISNISSLKYYSDQIQIAIDIKNNDLGV